MTDRVFDEWIDRLKTWGWSPQDSPGLVLIEMKRKKLSKKSYLAEGWKKTKGEPFFFLYLHPPQNQEEFHSSEKQICTPDLKSFFVPVGFQGPETGSLLGNAFRGLASSSPRMELLQRTKDLTSFGLRWNQVWYSERLVHEVLKYETAYSLCWTFSLQLGKPAQTFLFLLAQTLEMKKGTSVF